MPREEIEKPEETDVTPEDVKILSGGQTEITVDEDGDKHVKL